MSAKTYTVLNGAVPGAAAVPGIATNAAIRTMMQIATNTTNNAIRVVEWWTEFNGSAAATPITCELLRHTGGPQTTLTAYVAGDIAKVNDPNAPASSIQLGTALSGYSNTTTEVTPTTVSNLETHFVPPTSGIYVQFPLGREPEVQIAAFLRFRVTATASVTCFAGISWEE
jgi:hypothetical protein